MVKVIFKLWNDDSQEFEPTELPAKYEVCEACEGEGRECTLGAMTGDEYRELLDGDPDFPEDYKSGVYDRQCSCCKGKRVVAHIDLERINDPVLKDKVEAHMAEEGEAAAERRYERQMRERGIEY